MVNKIKIIQNLEKKINDLESGVAQVSPCSDFLASIEKQIKLNFENYYAELGEGSKSRKKISELDISDKVQENNYPAKATFVKRSSTPKNGTISYF